jgi:hypothetical protein
MTDTNIKSPQEKTTKGPSEFEDFFPIKSQFRFPNDVKTETIRKENLTLTDKILVNGKVFEAGELVIDKRKMLFAALVSIEVHHASKKVSFVLQRSDQAGLIESHAPHLMVAVELTQSQLEAALPKNIPSEVVRIVGEFLARGKKATLVPLLI